MNYGELSDDIRLDTIQAAQFLGVTAHALQVWRSTGRYDLRYIKIGRKVQYKLGDLRKFVEDRTRTHTGQAGKLND